jgi:hypothetical protein
MGSLEIVLFLPLSSMTNSNDPLLALREALKFSPDNIFLLSTLYLLTSQITHN